MTLSFEKLQREGRHEKEAETSPERWGQAETGGREQGVRGRIGPAVLTRGRVARTHSVCGFGDREVTGDISRRDAVEQGVQKLVRVV